MTNKWEKKKNVVSNSESNNQLTSQQSINNQLLTNQSTFTKKNQVFQIHKQEHGRLSKYEYNIKQSYQQTQCDDKTAGRCRAE